LINTKLFNQLKITILFGTIHVDQQCFRFKNIILLLSVYREYNTYWSITHIDFLGAVMVVIIWYLDLQLPVPITMKVVSSNPAHGEVYSIQHYVIKFVSDLRQVGGFWLIRFPPPIKLTATIYSWNIVESGIKHHKPNQPKQQISYELIHRW
jgi:hypothetical protein